MKEKISVENVSFVYNPGTPFEKQALSNVSFSVGEGEFIGLIGHTGSGKSTLIQHLNALIKPTSGEIRINGENIHADKKKLKTFRQKVGLVFQYPEHQLFDISVYKDVAYGPKNLGLTEEEAGRRAEEALEAVGVSPSQYNLSPFELSGGQKRRVAIAGVLAMQPEILVLDEPTAGLDPRGRDEILDQILQMRERMPLTVILVSHSMEDIARMVDRILVMHDGKLAYDAPPEEVFLHREELEQIGLAAPQVSYLMNGLKESGLNVPTTLFTVDAAADALYELCKQVGK